MGHHIAATHSLGLLSTRLPWIPGCFQSCLLTQRPLIPGRLTGSDVSLAVFSLSLKHGCLNYHFFFQRGLSTACFQGPSLASGQGAQEFAEVYHTAVTGGTAHKQQLLTKAVCFSLSSRLLFPLPFFPPKSILTANILFFLRPENYSLGG